MHEESIPWYFKTVDELVCNHCGCGIDIASLPPFTNIRCPDCDRRLPVPVKLDEYIILGLIGEGGTGVVYEAFEPILKRHVAIKVLHEHMSRDKKALQGIIQEAKVLASMNHPHIVQVFTLGGGDSYPYIVMQLADGGRLDHMIKEEAPLDEQWVLEMGRNVAEGLEAASVVNLIHGDVKPGNILFDQHQQAKIVDFGLVRAAHLDSTSGKLHGTPYYVAPEKVKERREDLRSDIYSLGATLYHALTGKPPFTGSTSREVVMKRFDSRPKSPRQLQPGLSDDTVNILARMMRVEPGERYPTYTSLIADFGIALHDLDQPKESMDDGKKRIIVHKTYLKSKAHADPVRPEPMPISWKPFIRTALISALFIGGGFLFVVFYLGLVERPAGNIKIEKEGKPRTIKKFIGGRLVDVVEEDPSSEPSIPVVIQPRFEPVKEVEMKSVKRTSGATKTFALQKTTTAFGQGADTYVLDDGQNSAPDNYGESEELWLHRGPQAGGGGTRGAVLLRFDLSAFPEASVPNPRIRLVLLNRKGSAWENPVTVEVWGIADGLDQQWWVEGDGGTDNSPRDEITWSTLPGTSEEGWDSSVVSLIARVKIPATFGHGETMVISGNHSIGDQSLERFIADDTDGAVSMILTLAPDTPEDTGLSIASKDHATSAPPTLILK